MEGCLDLIQAHESAHNLSYELVVRTRVDTFWNAPAPPLASFPLHAYTVPYGSQFHGYNDRFGAGGRRATRAALARLSLLPRIHRHLQQQQPSPSPSPPLNSETAFKLQLAVNNVTVRMRRLPFCVLSRRRYSWPPGHHGVPVLSILSAGPLNGAKCRPCAARATGQAARNLLDGLSRSWGWMGPLPPPEDDIHGHHVQLCDASADWDPDWARTYRQAVSVEGRLAPPPPLPPASLAACVREMEELRAGWASWEAPSARRICAAAGFQQDGDGDWTEEDGGR